MRKLLLFLEFVVICGIIPTLIIVNVWAPYLFAFLWSVGLYCLVIFRLRFFDGWAKLWHWKAVKWDNLRFILLRWAFASLLMAAFTAWYDPARLFYIPRHAPQVIPFILFIYPLLSALPQEFIFCNFLFRRYARFFGNGRLMVLVSASVFAYAHILYINPVAPVLSFFGGLIFAETFRLHRSLALVTIEHSLYGASLFLVGLGWYFYSGGVAVN